MNESDKLIHAKDASTIRMNRFRLCAEKSSNRLRDRRFVRYVLLCARTSMSDGNTDEATTGSRPKIAKIKICELDQEEQEEVLASKCEINT